MRGLDSWLHYVHSTRYEFYRLSLCYASSQQFLNHFHPGVSLTCSILIAQSAFDPACGTSLNISKRQFSRTQILPFDEGRFYPIASWNK